MKKLIQNILNKLGYKITKINFVDTNNLDYATKILTNKSNPLVFDVGANKGQSIIRYKKILDKPTIHSFEPLKEEVKFLEKKFKNEERIKIINCALGDKNKHLEFNTLGRRKASSFLKLRDNSNWLREKTELTLLKQDNFVTEKSIAKIITLDDYAKKKKIKNIDILKIDTQGYEDKVIKGAEKLIKKNNIKIIQLELIFSEIYEKSLNIYDIEKILIPNKYKLFGISHGGNLASDAVYQSDFMYISNDKYEEFKKSKFFKN